MLKSFTLPSKSASEMSLRSPRVRPSRGSPGSGLRLLADGVDGIALGRDVGHGLSSPTEHKSSWATMLPCAGSFPSSCSRHAL